MEVIGYVSPQRGILTLTSFILQKSNEQQNGEITKDAGIALDFCLV